jgi:hypothetical protein
VFLHSLSPLPKLCLRELGMFEEGNNSSKRNSMDSSSDRIVGEEEYHKANTTKTKSTSFCLQLGGLKNAEAWEKITTRKEQKASCTIQVR